MNLCTPLMEVVFAEALENFYYCRGNPSTMKRFNQYAPWQSSCDFYSPNSDEVCEWEGAQLGACNCEEAKKSYAADKKLEEL